MPDPVVFIHIHKNAGVSLQFALKPYLYTEPAYKGHNIVSDVRLNTAQRQRTIACVSNPYRRMVALYNWSKLGGEWTGDLNLAEWIVKYKDVKPFGNKSRYMYRNGYWFISQAKWTTFDDGTIIPNIIKFENLEEDFKKVCEHLNLPPRDLPNLNRSTKVVWQDFYNEQSQQLVQEIFEDDFKLFNYSTEIT